ncbi:MAG: NifB/NifX family molybdenum-iron cluster-binding protein [Sedimentisphaerales bacterium]|nr:NifB/NifX family molybdenum-iron cluster-binding protein [Sedimentisphaerales bacterium]
MKIAIPVYGEYVSNVFDFAHKLLLVDVENGKETNRSEIVLESKFLPQRAVQLKNLGADVLVCGAISQELANMVLSSGIIVFPFITGNVENVLNSYLAGQMVKSEFRMPGYRSGAPRGLGRQRRCCRWQGGRY